MTKRQKIKNLKKKLNIKGRTGEGTGLWSAKILYSVDLPKNRRPVGEFNMIGVS